MTDQASPPDDLPADRTEHPPGAQATASVPRQRKPQNGDERDRIRRRLERLLGIAATEGNTVAPLRNGDEIFPAMLDSIRAARNTIDMMTYVYWRGDIATGFAEALADRARAGVRVRLLLDGVGSLKIEKDLVERMEEAGVIVAWFRKPHQLSPFKQNHRCHRKVLVVDEEVAYTGGVGIAEEWCGDARDSGEWRDTHFQIRGPSVDGVAAAFAQSWAECHEDLIDERDRFTPQPPVGDAVIQVVRGSASLGWQDMQTLVRIVLESAQHRIRLASAYFAPDAYFTELMCATARRGVQIELLLPGPNADKRVSRLAAQRHYETLLECGVRIFQYQPTMLHTKIVLMDDTVALVGSTNFNRRSLDHDEEVMLAVIDEDLTATLHAHFEEDLARSEQVDHARWARRSARQRAKEAAITPLRRFL
ncbi:phospholipase D-like domain-containing protein [Actinomadura sp. 7K534]|uniref:phospholipase D-like domain-containing protein n=1 Tax=Actinomadura sp. 7K534 TaxID=2530366 RepID=UPI00105312AC|nr:phospholipase D-like domain-containing protein [Actinomadura sp. 7K534]TDB92010.1 cardiolipin synthase B [Actinomadura sp. 7K534]